MSAIGQMVEDYGWDYWILRRKPGDSSLIWACVFQLPPGISRTTRQTVAEAAEMMVMGCFISMLPPGTATQIHMHKRDALEKSISLKSWRRISRLCFARSYRGRDYGWKHTEVEIMAGNTDNKDTRINKDLGTCSQEQTVMVEEVIKDSSQGRKNLTMRQGGGLLASVVEARATRRVNA